MRTPVILPPVPPTPPERPKRPSRRLKVTREHPPIAARLLEDFNRFRARCRAIQQRRNEQRISDFLPSDERLELLTKYAKWCGEKKVDPRLFLFVLFRLRKWFWPPQLTEKELLKESAIPDYRRASGLDAYRRHAVEGSRVRPFDPNIDMAPATEALKARYIDNAQEQRCLDSMVDVTFGFHPQSTVCQRCPVATVCAEALKQWCDFDVLALREGRLPREQAQAAAREAAQRRLQVTR